MFHAYWVPVMPMMCHGGIAEAATQQNWSLLAAVMAVQWNWNSAGIGHGLAMAGKFKLSLLCHHQPVLLYRQAYAPCLRYDCQTLVPRVLATWLWHGTSACWGPPQTRLITIISCWISVISLEPLQQSKIVFISAIKLCSVTSVSHVIDG